MSITPRDRKPFFTDSDVSEIFSLPMVNLDLANAKVADLVEENARLREALERIFKNYSAEPYIHGCFINNEIARTALAATEKIE